jgi:hypothetical protein
MEKLGTLESEVLSEEVLDGPNGPIVKTVIRTVPGMKLPRIVRPILRGKEVEFRDTRTFSLGRVGTFHVILRSNHHLMTAGVVHVTNLTPGSDNQTTTIDDS